jgi:hypothetical protein
MRVEGTFTNFFNNKSALGVLEEQVFFEVNGKRDSPLVLEKIFFEI